MIRTNTEPHGIVIRDPHGTVTIPWGAAKMTIDKLNRHIEIENRIRKSVGGRAIQ